MGSCINVYFMRHGETPYNRQHLLQGQRDIALNETGRRQAEDAAEWCWNRGIHFCSVYSSPLDRAEETASLVSGFPKEQIITDRRILEIDFGPIEGRKWEDLSDEEIAYVNDPWKGKPIEGVESADHLIDRVSVFLKDLRHSAGKICSDEDVSGGQGSADSALEKQKLPSVLVVTHGMALHGILTALTKDRGLWKVPLGNCCIFLSRLDEEDGYSEPERLTPPVPTFR
ncbi:MAG: histidine phosphatase family protein [Eubacterium sp.]